MRYFLVCMFVVLSTTLSTADDPGQTITVPYSATIRSDLTGMPMTGVYVQISGRVNIIRREVGGTIIENTFTDRSFFMNLPASGLVQGSITYVTSRTEFYEPLGEYILVQESFDRWLLPYIKNCTAITQVTSYPLVFSAHPAGDWNPNKIIMTKNGVNKYLQKRYDANLLPHQIASGGSYSLNLGIPTVNYVYMAGNPENYAVTITYPFNGWAGSDSGHVNVIGSLSITCLPVVQTTANGSQELGVKIQGVNFQVAVSVNYSGQYLSQVRSNIGLAFSQAFSVYIPIGPAAYSFNTTKLYGEVAPDIQYFPNGSSGPVSLTANEMKFFFKTRWALGY